MASLGKNPKHVQTKNTFQQPPHQFRWWVSVVLMGPFWSDPKSVDQMEIFLLSNYGRRPQNSKRFTLKLRWKWWKLWHYFAKEQKTPSEQQWSMRRCLGEEAAVPLVMRWLAAVHRQLALRCGLSSKLSCVDLCSSPGKDPATTCLLPVYYLFTTP